MLRFDCVYRKPLMITDVVTETTPFGPWATQDFVSELPRRWHKDVFAITRLFDGV